jgi:hypothetical protein
LAAGELSSALAGGSEDKALNSLTLVPAGPLAAELGGNEVRHRDTTSLLLGVDLRTGGYAQLLADTNEVVLFREVVISAIRVSSLTIEAG